LNSYDSSAIVCNSIFWENHAPQGPEIALPQKYDGTHPSTISVSYSDVKGGQAGILQDSNCFVVWGPGNMDVDPCVVDPGHWDPNGTPNDSNDDFFVEGDYHLKSQAGHWDSTTASWIPDDVTSPCIDAGDPNSPIGEEPFPNGGRINMGAYGGTSEASKSYFGEPICEVIVAGDINGDCRVDVQDLAVLAFHWLETALPTRTDP
jgi:hypothetical protein